MIRDLVIAFFSVLGAGAAVMAIALVVTYRRAGPEFPPPEPGQRSP